MKHLATMVAAFVALLGSGCIVPDCEVEVQGELPIPDAGGLITAYELGCGATERLNTSIAIHDRGTSPQSGEMLFATNGRYDVTLRWTAPRALNVTFDCPEGCDTRIESPHVLKRRTRNISITYEYSDALQAAIRRSADR